MPYVTPETIEQARQVDLLSYLSTYEPGEVQKCGSNEYCLRSHDSLKISNGKWFWWSHGIGGKSALDFLVKVREMDFVSAVECITGKAAVMPPLSVPQKKKVYTKLFLPPLDPACNTVRKYLLSRGIDREIMEEGIRHKTIAEDAGNHYCLFIGLDEDGKQRIASVRSTDATVVKKNTAGSQRMYSFRLLSDTPNPTLRVFESAIDLLSFATLMKDSGGDYHRENLMSLSGVYLPKEILSESTIPNTVSHYLETHPEVTKIYLHLDNDDTGIRGAAGIQAAMKEKHPEIEVRYVPSPAGKDFNDYLRLRRTKQRNEREDTERE